jgi:hypothetical protein
MKAILSERNLVVVLFIMVLITFAFAHEDTKKMEKIYIGVNSRVASTFVVLQQKPLKEFRSGMRTLSLINMPE